MLRRTPNLKFVNGVLRQEWIDEDPPDEGAIRHVWRDVPSENDPATRSDSPLPNGER